MAGELLEDRIKELGMLASKAERLQVAFVRIVRQDQGSSCVGDYACTFRYFAEKHS